MGCLTRHRIFSILLLVLCQLTGKAQVQWTTPRPIDLPPDGQRDCLAMAVDDSGNIGVVWNEGAFTYSQIIFARSTDLGVTWTRVVAYGGTHTYDDEARCSWNIAFDHNGTI